MKKELIDRAWALVLLKELADGWKDGKRATAESAALDNAIGVIRNMPRETPEAEMLTKEEIVRDVIPTVIWLEDFGGNLTAGVWVHDHYEFEDGTVDESPKDMEAFKKGMYGRKYRIWRAVEPSEAQRDRTPWI
ncbi:MAG: hypothetical protein IKN00_04080 [Bacteroidales bacterium]|nr:hypothetical protein [Bacteroidales bacterium]